MEIYDIELQPLKDLWANNAHREHMKRAIAIASSKLTGAVPIQLIRDICSELDDLLLEKEQEKKTTGTNNTL